MCLTLQEEQGQVGIKLIILQINLLPAKLRANTHCICFVIQLHVKVINFLKKEQFINNGKLKKLPNLENQTVDAICIFAPIATRVHVW